jgi:hypothetical protein
MIFVLGISLIIVNIHSLVKTKEGFEDNEEKEEKENKTKESFDEETEAFDEDKEAFDEDKEGHNERKRDNDNDKEAFNEENEYMQNKSIMDKMKKLDPLIFNTIKNLNPVDIEKINKTINELTNKKNDP